MSHDSKVGGYEMNKKMQHDNGEYSRTSTIFFIVLGVVLSILILGGWI